MRRRKLFWVVRAMAPAGFGAFCLLSGCGHRDSPATVTAPIGSRPSGAAPVQPSASAAGSASGPAASVKSAPEPPIGIKPPTLAPVFGAAAARAQPPSVFVTPTQDMLPHNIGTSWSMVENAGGAANDISLTVEPTPGTSGEAFTIQTRRNAQVVAQEEYHGDAKGLYRDGAGYPRTGKIEPPMPVLQMPLTAGTKWSWKGTLNYPDGAVSGQAVFRNLGLDTVKTPAGQYVAYRIEQTFTLKLPSGSKQIKNTQWYAPHTGVVRTVTEADQQKITADLKAFQPK